MTRIYDSSDPDYDVYHDVVRLQTVAGKPVGPCEGCGKAQDIATEHIKMLTDRLDALANNVTWLCQTVNGILQSVPRNGMAGLMMRKVLNQQDQGQAENGD